ncbi:hypothetical protein D3Y57_07015 [Sphingomonas paeninsulae]|uniref:Terminase small subunit n=1 Tax=Sphingomonas paeninsulae TaxID=2319844 RepID=A0A494TK15_SPHPE|nr:hypothetical protein D3Y57_07015 [Sphingomonas paeninsulae]
MLEEAPDQDVHEEAAQVLAEDFDDGCITVKGGHGGHRLNARQRDFARHFVLTGGKITKSAVLAGYDSPGAMGAKNVCHPSILAEIKRLSVVNVSAYLPRAIRTLVDIMTDDKADTRARVTAATNLLDRAGLRPKSDAPGVQVNVQINGASAQAAIADVWKARETRLELREGIRSRIEERMDRLDRSVPSDISGRMSDTDDTASATLIDINASPPPGGMKPQGPPGSRHPYLLPEPRNTFPTLTRFLKTETIDDDDSNGNDPRLACVSEHEQQSLVRRRAEIRIFAELEYRVRAGQYDEAVFRQRHDVVAHFGAAEGRDWAEWWKWHVGKRCVRGSHGHQYRRDAG